MRAAGLRAEGSGIGSGIGNGNGKTSLQAQDALPMLKNVLLAGWYANKEAQHKAAEPATTALHPHQTNGNGSHAHVADGPLRTPDAVSASVSSLGTGANLNANAATTAMMTSPAAAAAAAVSSFALEPVVAEAAPLAPHSSGAVPLPTGNGASLPHAASVAAAPTTAHMDLTASGSGSGDAASESGNVVDSVGAGSVSVAGDGVASDVAGEAAAALGPAAAPPAVDAGKGSSSAASKGGKRKKMTFSDYLRMKRQQSGGPGGAATEDDDAGEDADEPAPKRVAAADVSSATAPAAATTTTTSAASIADAPITSTPAPTGTEALNGSVNAVAMNGVQPAKAPPATS